MIHVSASHKVVGVPAQAALQNLFPDARIVPFNGNELILLPHGYQETKMLRNMGYDVPAPILTQYKWTGTKTPFRVQQQTAAMLTTNQRAYCLNGMGTGKTKSVLWSFDYLRGNRMAHRMLVAAPLSILDGVWRKEAFETTPHLSVGVLYGDKKRRLRVLDEDHDIYIINRDGLGVIEKELLARCKPGDIDVFAIDELAEYRNGQSDRNKRARRIMEKMMWGWGLTGSPTPSGPDDAWGQCKIVTPHTVPQFFARFREEVMYKATQFKWVPKAGSTERVFEVMQPAVRFALDDVEELPELIEQTVDIAMGKKQGEVYEHMRKHAHVQVQQHVITAANAGAVYNKMLQLSMGYVYTSKKDVVTLDNTARLDATVEAVNGTPNKVLVFVPFTHALAGVSQRLAKEGIDHATVSGSTPKGARDEIFKLFQGTTKYRVIVAHPVCMSHGLTLTAADTIIWFGPPQSLETFEQANARIRRIGQRKKQLVLMFQSTAIEKKTYARLRARQNVQSNLLDMFAEQSEDLLT